MTKSKSHDRRGYYGKDALPKHARFAAVTIEDPYADAAYVNDDGSADLKARLDHAQHRDGTKANGAPGWTPPPRPTITVIRSLKDDPLGRMHARHQIDQAEYLAGRAYQECFVKAQLAHYGSISDMSQGGVDGGGRIEPLTENRQRALQRLRVIDAALAKRHGSEGVLLGARRLGRRIFHRSRRTPTRIEQRTHDAFMGMAVSSVLVGDRLQIRLRIHKRTSKALTKRTT